MRILSTNLVNLNPNGISNKIKINNPGAGSQTSKIIKLIKTSPEGVKDPPKKMIIFKKY